MTRHDREGLSVMQLNARGVHERDSADLDTASIAAIYAHHVLHGTASFETEAPSVAETAQRRADILTKRILSHCARQEWPTGGRRVLTELCSLLLCRRPS